MDAVFIEPRSILPIGVFGVLKKAGAQKAHQQAQIGPLSILQPVGLLHHLRQQRLVGVAVRLQAGNAAAAARAG